MSHVARLSRVIRGVYSRATRCESKLHSRKFSASAIPHRVAPDHPTVYALSTPPGRSAIATVRITGAACPQIYKALCPNTPPLKPRVATLRTLYRPHASHLKNEDILDPGAVVLYFPGPKSFTGEDVLELHLHGGPAIIKAVLSSLPQCAPRTIPAEPGDFTRRAFYNSRLTLPQIEALSQTLTAETEQQRLSSIKSTTSASALTNLYESWRTLLLSARGELEALIDFSEDQLDPNAPSTLLHNVRNEVSQLRELMKQHATNAMKGELMRSGISLAMFGAPNAGKSSLLNRIVGREAVIVNAIPGTTRDVVDLHVDIEGWMVVIGDTAGLRSMASDAVEEEGIRRARQRVLDADVVVLLVSLEPELVMTDETVEVAREALKSGKQMVVVVNKLDKLDCVVLPEDIIQSVQARLPTISKSRIFGLSCTSHDASHSQSIQSFMKGLATVFSEMTTLEESSEAIGATMRQKVLVDECVCHLEEFLQICEETANYGSDLDMDVVIHAEILRRAADCLSKITGRGAGAGDVEEVLGVVFERFCIGK